MPATPAAYEAACVAHLQRVGGRSKLSMLGDAIKRPAGVESMKAFLQERPHLFALYATQPGDWRALVDSVRLLQHAGGGAGGAQPHAAGAAGAGAGAAPPHAAGGAAGAGGAPPAPGAAPGCLLCGIGSFASAAQRQEHQVQRAHKQRVVESLQRQPKLGVTLTGEPELRSAPGDVKVLRLELRNGSAYAFTLLATQLLRPLREAKARGPEGANPAPLPAGQSVAVTLTHRPTETGSTRVLVVCTLRTAAGVPLTVGREVWLRCADAAAASNIAGMQPTAPYVRPRRPPPASAAPDMFTGASFTAQLPQADSAAALFDFTVAGLCEIAHQQGGALAGMLAAWAPVQPAARAEGDALHATVVMEGVPAAEAFGQPHKAALAHALAALLQTSPADITIGRVEKHPARITPGVPVATRNQMLRLENVDIPGALRTALGAKADDPRRVELEARLSAPLTPANHAARFRELLLCEEIQQQSDIRLYDMREARMRPDRAMLLLDVPGLAESRPSVMRGDKVIATASDGKGRSFEGVVHGVQSETLQLRFHDSFHRAFVAGMKHHVRFTLRRTPMLLMHAAVAAGAGVPCTLLFPAQLPAANLAAAAAAVRDAALPGLQQSRGPELNARQLQAVRGALSAPPVPDAPYVIFGPPGTGKTSTVVEYVLQVLAAARRPGSGIRAGEAPEGNGGGMLAGLMRGLSLAQAPPPALIVLVSAPSNSAVDVLAERLLQPRGPLRNAELLRVNAYQRTRATLPPSVLASSLWSDADNAFLLPTSRAQLKGVWVVAATCSTAQKLAHNPTFAGIFTHVAVDEAGQATEPECLCAVARLLRSADRGGARLVLAGDPRQLGPILRSPLASEKGLGLSLLERHTQRTDGPHRQLEPADADHPGGYHPAFVTMLTQNYRSHAALIAVPNERFYGGALVACADRLRAGALCDWPGLTDAARAVPGGFPLLFHGVTGEDKREGNSPSWFNPEEAQAVLEHVRAILEHRSAGVRQTDIGVVTPYHKQSLKIKELLRKHGLGDVAVGSVELFQGGERTAIILSAVRSSQEHVASDARHALGFLANPKRFNVAVTRARALLVIVGNPNILALDAHWAALLRHAVRHGAYRGCALPPGLDGGDGGAEEGEEDAEVLLQRVAAEDAARAAGDADEGVAEGPAWPNES